MENNTDFLDALKRDLCSGKALISFKRCKNKSEAIVRIEGSFIASAVGCCELMAQTVKRQGDTLSEQMQLLDFLYNTAKEYVQKSYKSKTDE